MSPVLAKLSNFTPKPFYNRSASNITTEPTHKLCSLNKPGGAGCRFVAYLCRDDANFPLVGATKLTQNSPSITPKSQALPIIHKAISWESQYFADGGLPTPRRFFCPSKWRFDVARLDRRRRRRREQRRNMSRPIFGHCALYR